MSEYFNILPERNQPCFCGSGKKYKKCCLGKEESNLVPMSQERRISYQRLLERQPLQNVITYTPDTEIKLSAVVIELAQDMLEASRTKAQRRQSIEMACVAYNLSVIIEENKLEQELENLAKTLDLTGEEKQDTLTIIHTMIQKKKQRYPDLDRVIMDFEIVDTRREFVINVASTPKEHAHFDD